MRRFAVVLMLVLPQALSAAGGAKPASRVAPPPPDGSAAPVLPVTVPAARFVLDPDIMSAMRAALVARREAAKEAADAAPETRAPRH